MRHRLNEAKHRWHHFTHGHRSIFFDLGVFDLCWPRGLWFVSIKFWFTPTGEDLSVRVREESIEKITCAENAAAARMIAYENAVMK